jgi:hypothetical protein
MNYRKPVTGLPRWRLLARQAENSRYLGALTSGAARNFMIVGRTGRTLRPFITVRDLVRLGNVTGPAGSALRMSRGGANPGSRSDYFE